MSANKVATSLLLIATAVVIVLVNGNNARRAQGTAPRTQKELRSQQAAIAERVQRASSLLEVVRIAKDGNMQEIDVPLPVAIPAIVPSLREAATDFHIIVVRPLEKLTQLNADNTLIRTWYKVKIVDALSMKHSTDCDGCAPELTIPQELMPVLDDEMVIALRGGTAKIDGVRVNQLTDLGKQLRDNEGETDTHSFITTTHQYLLLVSPDQTGRAGAINVGIGNTFRVTPEKTIEPMSPQGTLTPLAAEIKRIHERALPSGSPSTDDLTRLKNLLGQRRTD